jgi:hypothetical protein
MRVFNLSSQFVDYRGRNIPPNGYYDFPGLTHIPDRDRALERSRILAFGKLPQWWLLEQELKLVPEQAKSVTDQPKPLAVAKRLEDVVVASEETTEAETKGTKESQSFSKRR